MIKSFISRGVGLVAIMLIALGLPLSGVGAQQAGQGLEISPPLIDLQVDPGQVIETEIRLRNVTEEALVARAQYNDFVAGDNEDGNPRFLLDDSPTGEQSPYSIKDWLNTIPEIKLDAGEQKTVKVTINVPEDAAPGGHFGVIRFTGAPPEVDESAVTLSASVGTLVLLTVAGDIQEQAGIAEIYTSQNNKKRILYEYGPISITTRVENTGNVHVQPQGTLVVRDMFGRVVESFTFNETKGNILPESVRKFENRYNKKLLFGKYTVQADVVYGKDKTIVSASSTFWVIPYKLVIIGLVVIALLILAIKKYNRYIVNRAQKGREDEQAKSTKKKK
jgi:hypothetical protein